ncbi:Chitin synthase, class 1 [Entophlyctis luteolus]|nr:Chitin synthase, class 1 [Entophlyctis luteolus]
MHENNDTARPDGSGSSIDSDSSRPDSSAALLPPTYRDPVASLTPAFPQYPPPPPVPPLGAPPPVVPLMSPQSQPGPLYNYETFGAGGSSSFQSQLTLVMQLGQLQQQAQQTIALPTIGRRKTGAAVGQTLRARATVKIPLNTLRTPTVFERREVTLTDGEFVIDIPLGPDYLSNVMFTNASEFTHMRYTAVTTKPDEFSAVYTLRTQSIPKVRLAVVCTMYNEDDDLFCKSMSAVMDNIRYLCKSKSWGPDAWKEIVVVIVSDGVKPCNPQTLNVLAAMGLYMEGVPRASVNGSPVEAHLFELTTQVRIDRDLSLEFSAPREKSGQIPYVVPMQTIFLLKEKNAKKINSHRWFFNGICKALQPEVCILIDIGTKPTKQSFYHLYRAFARNPNVAGACGEIAAELGPFWKNLLNPFVAVQNFEYKLSNILDKPLESVCGYITVLPGAFSAYRYEALQGKPLEMYFRGEVLHSDHVIGKPNVSESNMYLAEDRILCFELVMKADHRYILKYVKSAKAETDVPTEFHDLIKQRRRWFNGSFFASVYAVQNFYRIFTSGHYFFGQCLLLIETLYNSINLVYAWFSIASMYCTYFFMFNIASQTASQYCYNATGTIQSPYNNAIVDSRESDPFYPYGDEVSIAIRGLYISAFVTTVVISLGNKPETIKQLLLMIAAVYATVTVLFLVLIFWIVVEDFKNLFKQDLTSLPQIWSSIAGNSNFLNLALSLLCTYVMYIISGLLYLDPWHAFTCLIQYLLMVPSFTNILMVYAFCNIHDISWGTKGQDAGSNAPIVQSNKNEHGKQVATTDLPKPEYANELAKLAAMRQAKESGKSEPVKRVSKTSEDHFRSYRTYVLTWWFLSNFLLAYLLTNDTVMHHMTTAGQANPFLVFLLWSVVVLTGVRFVGSFVFWLQWVVERSVDGVLR